MVNVFVKNTKVARNFQQIAGAVAVEILAVQIICRVDIEKQKNLTVVLSKKTETMVTGLAERMYD